MPTDNLISTINNRLKFLTQDIHPEILKEAILYALFPGGKRLRPLLVITTAGAYGAEVNASLDTACAIELIHTYSLIHDDLPSLDNDDFRRGRPSLHCQYSEGLALLCGDLLLTMAFDIIANLQNVSDQKKIQIVKILSLHSGSRGLVGGQVMDLDPQFKNLYEEISLLKTASLISCSLQCGAEIGDAPKQDQKLLQEIGSTLGIIYQLLDDLADEDPIPYSAEKALAYLDSLFENAHISLNKLSVNNCFLFDFYSMCSEKKKSLLITQKNFKL
ncbi:MAG: hypothetical protein Tsb0015_12520 [Simkaniaceae bacterium]